MVEHLTPPPPCFLFGVSHAWYWLCCGSCPPDTVKRKILVLDLDETLIHSHHDGVLRPTVRPGTPPDFILKVGLTVLLYVNILACVIYLVLYLMYLFTKATFSFIFIKVVIDKHPVRFFVHKRPHVDFFLEVVSVENLFLSFKIC